MWREVVSWKLLRRISDYSRMAKADYSWQSKESRRRMLRAQNADLAKKHDAIEAAERPIATTAN